LWPLWSFFILHSDPTRAEGTSCGDLGSELRRTYNGQTRSRCHSHEEEIIYHPLHYSHRSPLLNRSTPQISQAHRKRLHSSQQSVTFNALDRQFFEIRPEALSHRQMYRPIFIMVDHHTGQTPVAVGEIIKSFVGEQSISGWSSIKNRVTFRLIEIRLASLKLQRSATIHNNVLPGHGFRQSEKAYLIGNVLSPSCQQNKVGVKATERIKHQLTSTVANLPNFVAFFAASLFSSGNCIPHSVISSPGETEFTRILGEQMTARALLRWIAAAFVTEYGKLLPLGLTPATLAVVMKAPSVSSRWGLAA
jgi:hypothetical protein